MSIESLTDHTNDGTKRSPEQCLEDCLKDIGQRGAFKNGKKLLVICVDDTDGHYSVSWAQAGMNMSQCLTACEVAKPLFLREMRYGLLPEDVGQ